MPGPADVLGLRPGATRSEVVRAYRRLARASHPDRGGDPERFARVTEAYRALLGASGAGRGATRPPTIVRRHGRAALARRWWRRRRDRTRRPRVH